MRSPIATTYLLVLAYAVSDRASAFTATPFADSRLNAIRRVNQHTPTCAFPRIPFLQRNTEEVAVVDPPTDASTTVDTMKIEVNDHSVSTDVVPVTVEEAQEEPTKELSETEKLLKFLTFSYQT